MRAVPFHLPPVGSGRGLRSLRSLRNQDFRMEIPVKELLAAPQQSSFLAPERWPRRPYCTNELERGLIIRPRETALNFRYVQPNPPNVRLRLVFDVDTDDLFAPLTWESIGCAANWTASNRKPPPRPHTAYELNIPVLLADAD